jgi:hypothetical protein
MYSQCLSITRLKGIPDMVFTFEKRSRNMKKSKLTFALKPGGAWHAVD